MTKRNQDFEMHEGDSKDVEITVTDPITGAPVDLTGATISWVLKERASDATALLTLSTGGGEIVLTDEDNGVFEVQLDPADTAGLLSGNELSKEYYHEAEITTSGGDVATVTTGKATIYRDGV